MLTKRKIIVIIGIIVALLITFYTGVFGISEVA
jgi:Na+/melibiose symporter-like transporter